MSMMPIAGMLRAKLQLPLVTIIMMMIDIIIIMTKNDDVDNLSKNDITYKVRMPETMMNMRPGSRKLHVSCSLPSIAHILCIPTHQHSTVVMIINPMMIR